MYTIVTEMFTTLIQNIFIKENWFVEILTFSVELNFILDDATKSVILHVLLITAESF